YPEDIGLEGFSVVITQLIGLHIGLSYDDVNNCSCPRAPCIMQQGALSSSGMKTFSNCSMHDYKHYASEFVVKCLGNLSKEEVLQQYQPVCGNGIVEANEECDCGNDTLSAAGTPCRRAVDPECDFREYCNGSSSHCVPDTFALNGHLCRLGSAYCYNGRCQSLNDQDVLCGKLACFRPHKNYKNTAQSVIYSYVHDSVCLSIPPGLSMKSDGGDYAYVADGTVCGPQMYCINRTCKEVSLTRNDCNATKKCKGNG
ncbi:hypothetical protein A6R68_17394, partial [Neotoma lepida]